LYINPLPFHFPATASLLVLIVLLTYLFTDPSIPCFASPLPEEGPIPADLVAAAPEAPEAEEIQDGDDAKES
jgi:hypothetical protein